MVTWALIYPTETCLIMLYLCFCMGVGGFVQCLLKNVTIGDFRFPWSAALLLFGAALGAVALKSETLVDFSAFIVKLHPFDLMAIFIVPHIFKTAFQLDMHIFHKSLGQILVISTIGFSLCFLLIGYFTSYITEKEWPIVSAILFGIVVSMVDSKETNELLGQVKNLGVLLAGEEFITSSVSLLLYDRLIHVQNEQLKTDSVYDTNRGAPMMKRRSHLRNSPELG